MEVKMWGSLLFTLDTLINIIYNNSYSRMALFSQKKTEYYNM